MSIPRTVVQFVHTDKEVSCMSPATCRSVEPCRSRSRCQPPRHKLQPLAHGAPPRMNHPEHDGHHHGAGDDEEAGVDVPAVSFEAGAVVADGGERLTHEGAVLQQHRTASTPAVRCRPRRGRTRAGSCPGCRAPASAGARAGGSCPGCRAPASAGPTD
jgi:hypothetical protein